MKTKNSTPLPEFLHQYFWDVKFEDMKIEDNPRFILKRVIDRGDTRALKWALSIFTVNDIKDIITSSRDISRKTANFWADILNIDPKNVPSLQKPYIPRKKKHITAEYLNNL